MQFVYLEPETGAVLVEADADVGRPGEPEGADEHKGHDVAGVGEVFGERRGVLAIMDGHAGAHAAYHCENVAVGVDNGDERGPQHQDGHGHRVSHHVVPVELAHEGVGVEVRLAEVEQRRAAQHARRNPREHHPALAARLGLHRVIAQRLADRQVPVHAHPHERKHTHAPQSHFHIAGQSTHYVPVHPVLHNRRVHGQRHDQQPA